VRGTGRLGDWGTRDWGTGGRFERSGGASLHPTGCYRLRRGRRNERGTNRM